MSAGAERITRQHPYFQWLNRFHQRYGDLPLRWGRAMVEARQTADLHYALAETDSCIEATRQALTELDLVTPLEAYAKMHDILRRMMRHGLDVLSNAREVLRTRGLGGVSDLKVMLAPILKLGKELQREAERVHREFEVPNGL